MTTVMIVQARMGSTRLPGKVLHPLAGRTVLAHVLERCAAIPGVDVVCCATVAGLDGDPVEQEAKRCGAVVFRGSETDVLDRYYQAARSLHADIVMRVTSDCPLIDPALSGQVLRRLADGADYACNNLPPSWPVGLDCEAFPFSWLERAAQEAQRPSEREHVTPYLRNHPRVRVANVAGPGGLCVEHRWTLDTATDLAFLEALFARLPGGRAGWDYRVPLGIVEGDPELAAINAGQDRYEGLRRSLQHDVLCGYSPREPVTVRPRNAVRRDDAKTECNGDAVCRHLNK